MKKLLTETSTTASGGKEIKRIVKKFQESVCSENYANEQKRETKGSHSALITVFNMQS